jgi:hypothetical protein
LGAWRGGGSGAGVEDGGVEVGDDFLDLRAEELGGFFGGVEVVEGRLEEVGDIDLAVGQAAGLEQGEEFGLLGGEAVGDEPGGRTASLPSGLDPDNMRFFRLRLDSGRSSSKLW